MQLMRFPLFLVSALSGGAALAQNSDWTAVNLAVTDTHVIPAYQRFAETGAALREAGAGFCARLDEAALNELREAFNNSFDGWQGAQHIQFGPITYFNWNYRIEFWPDDNGTGARQLSALIAAADPAALEAESFARQSVGVQGFPALERLLFEDNALTQLQAEPYRCQVVEAISANLGEIATGVYQEWRDEFRATVASADERGFFESAEDATLDYLKSLVESIRRVQQQKLESVLGEDQSSARPRRAEAWRSDRSVQSLRGNVQALHELYSAGSPALKTVLLSEDLPAIDAAFDQALAAAAALPPSMNAALGTPEGYAALQNTRDSLDALYEALEAALKKTDLYLGFNSLDGD
ncbi:MAG: imelysin family protein [Pseudomonadales bacterium]|jgi:predicted lipoprotein|nr:imelysin family protein [Pseudomonadales bacterium]